MTGAATHRLVEAVGGPARLRVVALLAGVLALQGADTATVGAAAVQLERGLSIGNTRLGLLVTASGVVAALATLPFGALVDRVNRVRLITSVIILWSAAMLVCGAATSYTMLLLARLALGLVIAAAAPTVASLTGDLFPPSSRGRLYGFILAGELLGGGIGFLLCGNIAAAVSWRWAFWIMVLPSLALAYALHRLLPEPARGGPSPSAPSADRRGAIEAGKDRDLIEQQLDLADVAPHEDQVLRTGDHRRSLWWSVRYVLAIRTNAVLIAASALGYFLFSGVRTFGVIFVRERFGVGQGLASALLVVLGSGAVLGVLGGGRIADALLVRRNLSARPLVAGVAFLVAAALFVPTLLLTSLLVAGPLLFLAAASLGAVNPPLDAARLDLMPAALWGRAEGVRTVLRTLLEALAPLLIGWTSTQFGGHTRGFGHPTGNGGVRGDGLADAFLVTLVLLVAAGYLMIARARRTYPRDVATARASDRAVRDSTR